MNSVVLRIALVGCAVALAAGCGGSESSGDLGGLPGGALQGEGSGDDPGDTNENCALLTDTEIEEAIGEHNSGEQDYAYGGCVWKATDGTLEFTPGVHVAIMPQDQYVQLAETNTKPATDFAPDATYAELYGELWWPCQDTQYCLVKVDLADGDEREQVALQLGEVVKGRV